MLQMNYQSDTIAAISTPPGKGGISIVKISGPDSIKTVKKIFTSKKDPENNERTMVYGRISDRAEKIDEALVCYMKAPYSYTGEDVVEIQSHGGYTAAETILEILLRSGLRLAEPGEFTKRAFLNGKIDLAQAEGVMEIVSADNKEHLKNAERLLEGYFSNQIEQLLTNLKKSLSLLEYSIDFQEQESETVTKGAIKKSIDNTIKTLNIMITSYKTAKRIKHGLNVVIAGKTNSGKSSLFNTLLGKKRAIVHKKEGTTRDWLEDKIELNGIPINLIDTAGLRSTDCEIEREGVNETERLLQKADVVIYLHDSTEKNPVFKDVLNENPDYIHISSKSDLAENKRQHHGLLAVSSKTHEGISTLMKKIAQNSKSILHDVNCDSPVMVDRHRIELNKARKNMKSALSGINTWSEEIIAYELREAEKHLEAVTGQNIDIDVLDEIFKHFCVGK
ncbi:MAG TPA: tRNA uridine-5-carboxymethylaminomethyl(34) synthesis GTPase MnmE [bacterium]|nr:tRNA uridine-5-carboxymethylaminomethyl(34) synthesis GTPase MnmE [bacterium]